MQDCLTVKMKILYLLNTLEFLLNSFSLPPSLSLSLFFFWGGGGCFSDALVEEDVGNSVADIFKKYGETFFRNKEVS